MCAGSRFSYPLKERSIMRYCVLIVLVALGCGARSQKATPLASDAAATAMMEQIGLADSSASTGEADSGEPLPNRSTLERKIIYTADIDLVVEQFDSVPKQVEALAGRFDGYVASSDVSGSPGYPRTGRWTLRIPVAHYEECLAAARELGEVRKVSSDSQDVSEEFYDVEARIRNKKKEETRLLELLEHTTGKLEEILAVERELSRVRGEIEQVEGRLRVLNDLTSLTTINLSVDEIKDYVPEETATYLTRVRRGFSASIAALISTAQALSIAVIVLLPWMAVLLVVGIVVMLLWRLCRRLYGRQ